MIGDRYSDIICGRRVGCKTIFIDRNYKEKAKNTKCICKKFKKKQQPTYKDMQLDNLNIKIFADGAEIESIKKLNSNKFIKGFTTNPSLMKKLA